jgi:hypothetical protein
VEKGCFLDRKTFSRCRFRVNSKISFSHFFKILYLELYSYDKAKQTWGIGACGRSTFAAQAPDDLLYLQGLPGSAQTTRIAGILKVSGGAGEVGQATARLVSQVKVKVIGENSTSVIYTNADGVYEIYGLPPGKYSIEPEIPPGLRLWFPVYSSAVDETDKQHPKVTLLAKQCAGVDFYFTPNTSVTGKVRGKDGQGLGSVCLDLQPKEKKERFNRIFACTNQQGDYKMDKIPAGEYLLVANADGKISSREPFPATYYPGVFERDKATVLSFKDGANLEGYDIQPPTLTPTYTIEGVLVYADGAPAAKQFVEFQPEVVKEGYEGKAGITTDAQGRFTLTVLAGLKGHLYGSMHTYQGEYLNCPLLDELIKAAGTNIPTIKTAPLSVEIKENLAGVKLIFSFPLCEKAKH